MIVLGIETSCDETALSLIEIETKGGLPHVRIIGESLYSQTDIHARYGGVFPMMAKREHAKNLVPLLVELLTKTDLKQDTEKNVPSEKKDELASLLEREPELLEHFMKDIAPMKKPRIDTIAVTYGPGLEPALWVGINFAFALKTLWDIPVIPTNHMEGHISGALIDSTSSTESLPLRTIIFPAIALLISGGHTEIVEVRKNRTYSVIGETRDDAVGEAFDKVARILGLPYPGGPHISRLAAEARKKGVVSAWKLPRPMINSNDLDFSFSGLKTAVLYTTKKIPAMTESVQEQLAREFEDAATEVLVAKTKKAIREVGARTLILGGGVIANDEIRNAMRSLAVSEGVTVHIPDAKFSTDNASMIAVAGALRMLGGETGASLRDVRAKGSERLASPREKL